MRVMFKRKFFGKDGNRFRPGTWYDVPDDWRGHLPRDAVIDESVVAPTPVKESKKVSHKPTL